MHAAGAQLQALAALYDASKLRPVLDRTYPFAQTVGAVAYVERRHAKGKVVVTMPELEPSELASLVRG